MIVREMGIRGAGTARDYSLTLGLQERLFAVH
jgi:hypothetical protein